MPQGFRRTARIGRFKLSATLGMQVSSPKLGEVAAAVRKWRASSLAPQTEWFPNRMFQRFGLGTTPLRLLEEVVSICLLPQPPLLT